MIVLQKSKAASMHRKNSKFLPILTGFFPVRVNKPTSPSLFRGFLCVLVSFCLPLDTALTTMWAWVPEHQKHLDEECKGNSLISCSIHPSSGHKFQVPSFWEAVAPTGLDVLSPSLQGMPRGSKVPELASGYHHISYLSPVKCFVQEDEPKELHTGQFPCVNCKEHPAGQEEPTPTTDSVFISDIT